MTSMTTMNTTTTADAALPRWIAILGGLITALQLVNALVLRFFTAAYAPAEALSPFVVQMLVNPFSSRIFALYAVIGVALLRRERRPLGFLLLVAATIEIIDMLTIVVNIALGRSDLATIGFAVPVLLFTAFYLLAARALLTRTRTPGATAAP